jgi:plastocyanin
MQNFRMALAVVMSLCIMGVGIASAHKVKVLDDCDPTDPGWAPTGGCALPKGDVDLAEFNALLSAPLEHPDTVHERGLTGHPAWRFEPQYIKIEEGETVSVKNNGGRLHTFTEVENFGGGRVAGLNFDLLRVPECPLQPPDDPNNLPPGAKIKIKHLSQGTHLFICCIHPWMRAVIKVQPEEDEDQRHR